MRTLALVETSSRNLYSLPKKMPRKRARDEAELDSSVLSVEQPRDDPVINRLRNMWQFASLMQYLQFFGSAVKIDDDLDIEVYTSDFTLSLISVA